MPTNDKISEIKTLLNTGADINSQSLTGNTALHYAVAYEDIEIIKLLVSHNANPNIKNSRNKTPLDNTKRSDIKRILVSGKRPPPGPDTGSSKKHKTIDVEPSTSGAQLEEIYEKAGLISAQHGVEYQKRLLVMFYLRGVKSRYDFQLATEMVAAEKFDDVVFKYKEPNSDSYNIRFIQAKHKLDENTKIKFSDLTTSDVNGEFNLRKYFDSFRKISQNELFKTDVLKDFVLTTNIYIDPNIIHLFEQSMEIDIVFENKKLEKPKIYRLSEQSKSELVPMFQETSDLHQLAKKFAQLAHSNSDIDLKSALIKKYYKSLVYENIIDIDGKKLNANFISDNKLSKVAQDFRKIFVEEYKGLLKRNEIFDINKINLKLSGTFDKLKKRSSTEVQRKCAGWLAKLVAENKGNEVLIQNIPPGNLAYLEEMAGHVFVDHVSPNRFIFDRNFVHASNIPQNVMEFRNLLDAELKQKKFNFPEIDRLKLTIFGYKPTGLPKNVITDADINKFYKTFKMAVNQPNEQKLYGIIEKEIPDSIQSKSNLRDNLLVEVGDWMISQKGTYLTKERITKYTKQMKEQNIWFEVGKPIESFSGREEELRKLKFLVEEELGHGANWRSRLLVVKGFKGIGKSELVKKYVNDNANTFDKNIVWLDGQSLEESFYKLARSNDVKISTTYEDGTKKPVENIVNEVYEFFVRNEKKGLFIFDNVDHFEKIKSYLPSKVAEIDKLKIKFLATSDKDWDMVSKLNLDVFKLEESRNFLLENLEDYVNSDFIGFEKLSTKMSNFPLALEQSIAYIREQNKILKLVGKTFKIEDYLSRFETKAKELLNYDYSKYSLVFYDKNVLTNVALTLDVIKEKGTEAVEMANIMAYLDPNDISIKLFLQNENIENTARMISYLKDYSLINSGERGNTFYMHELIQQIIRIQLKEAGTEFTVIENTLNLLRENSPTERLNHVINIWKYVHKADSFKDKYVSLMKDAMKSLIDEGRYNEVESFGNQILINNEKHSLESLYKTEIERFKSYALVEKGQYDKALILTKNLHETAIEKKGPTDFETLKRYADYGTVLLKQKKFEHSLEVFDFIINNVKNEENEFKTFVKNNKAIALLQNGKANEAIELLNEIQRDNSGKKLDKLTFILSDNKAFSLYKNGQMKESLTEYNILKEKCETEYGYLHVTTQKTVNNIGMVYRAMGEYKTALNQFTSTFNYFQSKFGSEHPLTLKSKLCIANVYVDVGNIQQALDIYNEVHTTQENSLVDESVKLKTEYLKAKALLQDKNHPESIKMFTDILNKADKIFGKDHSIREKIREELNELEEVDIAFGADRCAGTSRLRRNPIQCFDSTKEEMLKENTKSQVEHYFRNTEIHGMEYKQFYMYLTAASEQVAKNDILNPELQKLLEKQLKNIRLEFVEPAIRPIVRDLQKNINNKTKFKFILKTGSYHVIKAAEKINHAFILLMVAHDISEGDMKALAFDVLNIAVLSRLGMFTEKALFKVAARFSLLGIEAAAPFIGEAVGSIFSIYQLVDSIMDRKNAYTIAEKSLNNLNIISNSLFLAAETPILVGTALSSFGFAVEGFTAVAGPFGFLIGTTVLIGSHFLQAKYQVDKINEQIKLMDDERSSLYWRFVEFRSIPDYLSDDIEAKHIFKQYAETTVHDFKSNYDTVGMSLPCIKSNSYDYRSSNIRYPFIKKGSVSRELPSSLSDYEAVCAPTDLNVKKTGDSLCLTEYPSECQNVFILKSKRNRGLGNAFYMPTEATININNAEHVNNLFIIKELSSSMIINESNNTFILMGSKFNCNLGNGKQNNVIVVQESATIAASNIKGIQCNNNTNVINFEQADYVDCNGGKDVLHSKRYSIFKSYYGDTFNGEGLVLLPMKLKEIIKINVDAKNFTSIFSTKGSLKIYKTMHLQTLDGFLVYPLRTYNQTEVTHMQVINRVPSEQNMQQAIEELREVNNPSFVLSKQAINKNKFHVVLGDNANHVFDASESQFKTIYWEAPDDVDHLYLIRNYPVHITIGKANGLLDFSMLYTTFEDALIFVTHESIIFEIRDLTVTVMNNYKRLVLKFGGNKFYTINNGKIERDYCVKTLNIDSTIQINVTDMNYYNCFAFNSEKAIFVKIDKNLWIMTDQNVLSIIDYYKDLDHPVEFTVKLNNKLIIPDEVNERVKNFHTFVIYEPKDGEQVDVFHNQPLNNYQIGLLSLNNHSIVDFDLKFEKNNSLLLSNKGARVALLENWKLLPEAREMVFSFNDSLLYLPKCVIGSCAAEDILNTFYNEKKLVQGQNLYIHKMYLK